MLLKIVYLLVRRILGLAALISRKDLAKDAELVVLRHENAMLRRHGRVRYQSAGRVCFAALARPIPRRRWAKIFPITPATLLAWHRRLAASKYDTSKWRTPGRPPAVPEHRPPCRSPGEGESVVGLPPDTWRDDEARRDSRAVHRLEPPDHGRPAGHLPNPVSEWDEFRWLRVKAPSACVCTSHGPSLFLPRLTAKRLCWV